MKILLIRLSALGDLVYLTCPIEALYNQGHEVHLLTESKYTPLFQEDFRIKKVWMASSGTVLDAENLYREWFDIAVDLQKKPITLKILKKINSKKKLRFHNMTLQRRLHVWIKSPLKEVHIAQRFIQPLYKASVIPDVVPPPRILTNERESKEVPSDRYVLLAPEASSKTKEFPYFKELAEWIKSKGIDVVIVGLRKGEKYPGFDMRGKTDLKKLILLIKNARLVIANDSGPAHIAVAMKKPLIAFFGPTVPQFGYRPFGYSKVVLFEENLGCRPCHVHGSRPCRFSEVPLCLAKIKIENVISAVKDLLQ